MYDMDSPQKDCVKVLKQLGQSGCLKAQTAMKRYISYMPKLVGGDSWTLSWCIANKSQRHLSFMLKQQYLISLSRPSCPQSLAHYPQCASDHFIPDPEPSGSAHACRFTARYSGHFLSGLQPVSGLQISPSALLGTDKPQHPCLLCLLTPARQWFSFLTCCHLDYF